MISAAEKILIILKRMNLTMTDLANKLGQSKQNINNKISRNDLKESDMIKMADALDCDMEITFTLPDGSKI